MKLLHKISQKIPFWFPVIHWRRTNGEETAKISEEAGDTEWAEQSSFVHSKPSAWNLIRKTAEREKNALPVRWRQHACSATVNWQRLPSELSSNVIYNGDADRHQRQRTLARARSLGVGSALDTVPTGLSPVCRLSVHASSPSESRGYRSASIPRFFTQTILYTAGLPNAGITHGWNFTIDNIRNINEFITSYYISIFISSMSVSYSYFIKAFSRVC